MADSTISGLTAATALQAADLAAVVQSGTTKKATLAQIQANSLPLAGGTMTGALVAPPSSLTNSASTEVSLRIGSDISLTTVTDATRKKGILGAPHYTNAEQNVGVFLLDSNSSYTALNFGGGASATNAVTQINFYAAANTITTIGTAMMNVRTAGVRIQSGATAAAGSLFHVSATGDANALRVNDSNGNMGIGRAPSGAFKLALQGTFLLSVTGASITKPAIYRNIQAAASGVGVAVTLDGISDALLAKFEGVWDGAATTDSHLRISTRGGSSDNEVMRLTSTGNLLVGTTTDVATSLLTLASTTQGFLPPRMTTTQRDAIGSPDIRDSWRLQLRPRSRPSHHRRADINPNRGGRREGAGPFYPPRSPTVAQRC